MAATSRSCRSPAPGERFATIGIICRSDRGACSCPTRAACSHCRRRVVTALLRHRNRARRAGRRFVVARPAATDNAGSITQRGVGRVHAASEVGAVPAWRGAPDPCSVSSQPSSRHCGSERDAVPRFARPSVPMRALDGRTRRGRRQHRAAAALRGNAPFENPRPRTGAGPLKPHQPSGCRLQHRPLWAAR